MNKGRKANVKLSSGGKAGAAKFKGGIVFFSGDHQKSKLKRFGKVTGTLNASKGKMRVAAVRTEMGISQEELARVTGYSTRSIAGWESGKVVSDSARQKLAETNRLTAALTKIIGSQNLGEWMRTPNPAFEGQTPIQIMERGESDRLWRMIFEIDAGVAS